MSGRKTEPPQAYPFTAVYERRGRWYVAYVEELLGVNTQGRTINEARAHLTEALQLIIEANRELAERHPPDHVALREGITADL